MNIGSKITLANMFPYIIEDKICGGMAEVYKLKKCQKEDRDHYMFKDILAGKTYKDNLFTQQYKSMFEKELHTWLSLNEDHIVPLLLITKHNDKLFGIMPWYEMNLNEYIASIFKVGMADIKRISISIASAMEYANKTFGIIHRDLKPENVLVQMADESALFHVTDWGISSINRNMYLINNTNDQCQTIIGAGTPCYMSPERIIGGMCDLSGDIFSLGMIIYKTLFNNLPFENINIEHVRAQLITGKYYKIAENNLEKLNTKLSKITLKCLNPDKTHRYGEYSELISDLNKL
jgi:serine/threonine protein kinase